MRIEDEDEKKIRTPYSGNPLVSGVKCEQCGITQEDASTPQLLQCAGCHKVCYCSRECQIKHWKSEHKKVCVKITAADREQGMKVIEEMKRGDISSVQTLQRSDAAYEVAKQNGLFSTIEKIFHNEMEGKLPEDRRQYSYIQEIITMIFKGNREVHDRYTCACPVRMKEFILSSPTAWDNMMDATLYLAKILTEEDPKDEGAWRHRAARDVFATMNLALIHKRVAKAIFFSDGKSTTGKRSQQEARRYALDIMAPKLQTFFNNGGEGFAPSWVDTNETIQNNVNQFTAMLSYWFRMLNVDEDNPNAFIEAMELDSDQEQRFETIGVVIGEGMIQYGRTLTMDEFQVARANATAQYQAKKGKKKGGKKKKNRR